MSQETNFQPSLLPGRPRSQVLSIGVAAALEACLAAMLFLPALEGPVLGHVADDAWVLVELVPPDLTNAGNQQACAAPECRAEQQLLASAHATRATMSAIVLEVAPDPGHAILSVLEVYGGWVGISWDSADCSGSRRPSSLDPLVRWKDKDRLPAAHVFDFREYQLFALLDATGWPEIRRHFTEGELVAGCAYALLPTAFTEDLLRAIRDAAAEANLAGDVDGATIRFGRQLPPGFEVVSVHGGPDSGT